LLRLLARAIRPIMTRLFPEVPAEHPAMAAMIMNISANMLGLGNAATPLGIKAMQELNKLSKYKGVATNAMCLFLAINTSGLALLPSGVVSIRAAEGSLNPWGIMATTLFATLLSTIVGVTAAKLLSRMGFFKVKAPEEESSEESSEEAESTEESEDSDEVKELMDYATPTPDDWRVWTLRGILVGVVLALAGPALGAAFLDDVAAEAPAVGIDMASPRWATVQLPKGGEWSVTAAQVYEGGPSDFSTTIQKMVHPMADAGIPGTAATVTSGRFSPDGLGTYTLLCEGDDCEKLSYTISTFKNPPDELRHVSDQIGDGVIPALVVLLLGFGALRKVKVYEVFVAGARDGFSTAVKIIPYLVAILFAVGMLRAAGGMSLLGSAMGPVLDPLGVPAEILPMALLRPLSGSGAYGLMIELIQTHGPDSPIGYLASTLQGSTETTFYVLAVYFGSVNVTKTRHAALAGLSADFAGFIGAILACRLLLG
jgi:spore maturation protein SpmB